MINKNTFQTNFRDAPNAFVEMVSSHFDISGAVVVDFGCGHGIKTLGIALHAAPKRVLGVDINSDHTELLPAAQEILGLESLPQNLEFRTVEPGAGISSLLQADCLFSWSVFEHIRRRLLDGIVKDHFAAVKPGGFVFLQVNPLFYSPHGSHLRSIIDEPWAHLLLEERDLYRRIMETKRGTGRDGIKATDQTADGAVSERAKQNLWGCFQSLNRITAPELVDCFETVGFELVDSRMGWSTEEPPARLLHVFHRDVLRLSGVQLLFRKAARD